MSVVPQLILRSPGINTEKLRGSSAISRHWQLTNRHTRNGASPKRDRKMADLHPLLDGANTQCARYCKRSPIVAACERTIWVWIAAVICFPRPGSGRALRERPDPHFRSAPIRSPLPVPPLPVDEVRCDGQLRAFERKRHLHDSSCRSRGRPRNRLLNSAERVRVRHLIARHMSWEI
jgi:hypothetical protein